jgi:hypothetical protein
MKKICEYDHKSSKGKHFVVPDDSNPQSSFPFKLNIPVPRSGICHGMFRILCHEACEVRLTRARKEEEEEEDG